MRVRPLYALLAGVGLLAGNAIRSVAQAPSAEPAPSQAADRAAFEAICGACHTSSMVSDLRTEPEWEETVEQMVSIGAKATGEQLQAVMRVLLRTLTKVNVNTASAAQLPLVLDVPEAVAQAVVRYRGEHGNFKTLDDLKKVPGINAAKLDTRKDRVVF